MREQEVDDQASTLQPRCPLCEQQLPTDAAASPTEPIVCGSCALIQQHTVDAAAPLWSQDPAELQADSEENARRLATNIALRGDVRIGARVLDVGGPGLSVLPHLRDWFGVEGYVASAAATVAAQCTQLGLNAQPSLLDPAVSRTQECFNHVLLLDVLDFCNRPIELLLRCRSLLAPGGKLLLEVPNALPGGEPPERWTWGPKRRFRFSLATLTALLRRSGFTITFQTEGAQLLLAAVCQAPPLRSPHPFQPGHTQEESAQLAQRLRAYFTYQAVIRHHDLNQSAQELVPQMVEAAASPSYPNLMVETTVAFVERCCAVGDIQSALQIAQATARGPHPMEIRQGFTRLSQELAQSLASTSTIAQPAEPRPGGSSAA